MARFSAATLLLAGGAMRLAIDLVLILVTVIGGRIVPAFTANALRRAASRPAPVTHAGSNSRSSAAMVAIAVTDVFCARLVAERCAGRDRGAGARRAAQRLAQFRTGGEPILWVLHVAYAWLPVGLALKAPRCSADAAWAAKWQHALTFGAFATMILAVMTRASLGHTGRPLVVSRAIAVAYLLLTLGAVLRVFGVALFPRTLSIDSDVVGARLDAGLRHFRNGVRAHPLESARGRQTGMSS